MYRKSILFQDAKETENGVNGREEYRGSSTVFPGIVSSEVNERNTERNDGNGTGRNSAGENNESENSGNGSNMRGNNGSSESGSGSSATPVIPLPNPGEGGPVYPGNNTGGNGNGSSGSGSNSGAMPVIPLPNPGEGGPVYPGNNTGGNGSSAGGSNGNSGSGSSATPVIPLPNPGEGGPVYPGNNTGGNGNGNTGNGSNAGGNSGSNGNSNGNGGSGNGNGNSQGGLNIPAIIGTIITTFPRPGEPCKFCANSSQSTGKVRFLNAASNYNPFRVYINDQLFVQTLNFAEVTAYEKVPNGYQIVTIMGDNNYIYIQKPVMVPRDGAVTIAICNTQTGLDLFVISDTACSRSNYLSCLRVCNLSLDSGALSVVVGNNDVSFMNVSFQEITSYKILTPENYLFYVLNGRRRIILTSILSVKRNTSYTMYLINWNVTSPDTITVLMVEEHNG